MRTKRSWTKGGLKSAPDSKRKPSLDKQASLLTLRRPFAGYALGLGKLVAGYFANNYILAFLRNPDTVCGSEVGPHVGKHEILWRALTCSIVLQV